MVIKIEQALKPYLLIKKRKRKIEQASRQADYELN